MFWRKRVVEATGPTLPQRKRLLSIMSDDNGNLVLVGEDLSTGGLEVCTVSVTPAIAPVQVRV